MEGIGMEASSPSIFEIMLGWFTPTVLFLILNLVIGTIVLTSKAMHRNHGGGAATAAPDDRPRLSRTSSAFVLDRLRSLGLYRHRSGEIPLETSDPPPPPAPTEAEIVETVQAEESMRRSSTEKEAVVRRPAAAVRREEKEAVVRQPAAAVRREEKEEEEKEVDARADDFINRFRHQLRLQRLESLTQYKEMINRGK